MNCLRTTDPPLIMGGEGRGEGGRGGEREGGRGRGGEGREGRERENYHSVDMMLLTVHNVLMKH